MVGIGARNGRAIVTPADPYAIVVIAADGQLGIGVFRLRILVVPFGCGFAFDTRVYCLRRETQKHRNQMDADQITRFDWRLDILTVVDH